MLYSDSDSDGADGVVNGYQPLLSDSDDNNDNNDDVTTPRRLIRYRIIQPDSPYQPRERVLPAVFGPRRHRGPLAASSPVHRRSVVNDAVNTRSPPVSDISDDEGEAVQPIDISDDEGEDVQPMYEDISSTAASHSADISIASENSAMDSASDTDMTVDVEEDVSEVVSLTDTSGHSTDQSGVINL